MQKLSTSQLRILIKGSGGKLALINTLPGMRSEETEIPHAKNIPLESHDFEDRIERIAGGKSRPVVVYSTDAECPSSARAAERLVVAGFTDVWDYEGGAKAWRQAQSEGEI